MIYMKVDDCSITSGYNCVRAFDHRMLITVAILGASAVFRARLGGEIMT